MINGNKINLIRLDESFLEPYLFMVNDEVVHQTTSPGEAFVAYSEQQILEWLTSLKDKSDRYDFAILNKEGTFVGEVVLNYIQNQTCNLRIVVSSKHFDKGYGTEAVRLTVDYALNNLGLQEVTLEVYKINPRAVKVYERVGFVVTGSTQENGFEAIQMKATAQSFK